MTTQTSAATQQPPSNVIDLFTGRPLNQLQNTILRIAPEHDQLEILYSNNTSSKFYSLKIVCWALREQGDVVAMVVYSKIKMSLKEWAKAMPASDSLHGFV